MGLRDEILEQPAAAERLLESVDRSFGPIAAAVAERRPGFAVIAARGSSDNAGIYAQYLLAVRNRLVVALAAPSTITLYGAQPDMSNAMVVAISQSGRSPDIIAVVDEARGQGALTIAMTNDATSPLAAACDHVVDLHAGPELATAATKTYTTELLAAAALSGALDEFTDHEAAELARVPGLMRDALATEGAVRAVAGGHADRKACVVLGRGFSYATAREWALKLQETAQVAAMPYSAADFAHGPLALAEPSLAVCAVARSGPELESQLALLHGLKVEHRVRLLIASDSDDARDLGEVLPLPTNVPAWLGPIVDVIPAQLYTYHLTLARGLDPEQLRTITKVTETR